jgi:hypothetical protein
MLCYVMLRYVTLRYVMLYYIILYYMKQAWTEVRRDYNFFVWRLILVSPQSPLRRLKLTGVS